MPLNSSLVTLMRHWITEREAIRVKKDSGVPRPWTRDPILQQFKFCNVRREDDRVTRWFAQNWRAEEFWDEANFIPAIMLGRTINWPPTLEFLGFPYRWDKEEVYGKLEFLKKSGKKVYTGAYMVTQYGSTSPKNVLVTTNANDYFTNRPVIYPDSLEDTWKVLQTYPGMGPFMAAQVAADLKHTKHLANAVDWHSWASLGPGSTRGLNRLHGRSLNYNLNQTQGLEEMTELADELGVENLVFCMQDIQNCLCEFDKYMRVYNGEGAPRSRYDGYGPG